MAYELGNNISASFEPGEDLSEDQFKFVTEETDGTVTKSTWGEYPIGVIQNEPSGSKSGIGASGIIGYQVPASVVMAGVTRLRVDGVIARGTFISAGLTGASAGIGTDASGTYKLARAVALENSTAADDVITVRLIDQNPA